MMFKSQKAEGTPSAIDSTRDQDLSAPRRRDGAQRLLYQAKLGMVFCVCFLAATLGLGIAFRLILPPIEIVDLTAKLHPLLRNDSLVDTIAIGSSRVLRDFDPSSFDAGAQAAGCMVHSYNLGIADLNMIEMRYVLEQIAISRPLHLKRILIDPPNEIYPQFANLSSERMWVTTDPRETVTALSSIWSHPDPRKLSATVRYAIASLYRDSDLGMLGRLLHPGPTSDPPWPATMDAAGYQRQDPNAASAKFDESHMLMVRTFDQFKLVLADLRRESTGEMPPVAVAADQERRRVESILDLTARVRSMGYQPVVLHLPDTYGQAITDAGNIESALTTVQPATPDINLMRGEQAGSIYSPDAWYDRTHLNTIAAARASEIAGKSLCSHLGGV